MTAIPYTQINSRLVSIQDRTTKIFFDDDTNNSISRETFLVDIFLPTLENLINEILDESVPFIADIDEHCQYCPFTGLCKL
jgi:hypothetical protein